MKENGTLLAEYGYNVFGQRMVKDTVAVPAPVGTDVVHFVHDSFGRIISETQRLH